MARRTMLVGWMEETAAEVVVMVARRAWSRPAMAHALSISSATEAPEPGLPDTLRVARV